MKRKSGINVDCINRDRPFDNLKAIKEAGFESFFTLCYDDFTLQKLVDGAKEYGLDFEFIHSPWKNINSIWTDENPEILTEILKSITKAGEYGIEGVIVHLSSGYTPPEICDLGLRQVDLIVETAKKCGVKVAFENIRKVGNIAYIFDRYEKEDHVGFCYDCGHEHCYTDNDVSMLDLFGKRTIYTHIHDNFGISKNGDADLHMLPFEGDIDYKKMIEKLDKYNYTGSLVLEVLPNNSNFKDEELMKEAYKRFLRIQELSNN